MRSKNRTLKLAILCVAVLGSGLSWAQSFPSKPIRIMVPFPPAGGTDTFARLLGQKLSEALNQQVVIDNRSGASGMLGSEVIARAAPDGYALLITSSSSHSINPHLLRKPLYHPLRDFTPVIHIASAPQVLVVHPTVPSKSVKALIALAKERPNDLSYASSGAGALSHLTGELFKLQAGINMLHVPYKGGPPAMLDVIAGQVSLAFVAIPTAFGQLRAGKLRPLAVTSLKRVSQLPELPPVADTLPGFEANQWWGMFAPAGTPAGVVNRINSELSRILTHADVKARFATDAAEPVGGSPHDFAAFHKADYEKWGEVIEKIGLRAD